jgi:transcriptional regulator with XRE-family HTH domain
MILSKLAYTPFSRKAGLSMSVYLNDNGIGARLAALRKEKKVLRNGKIETGMTQKEVAEELGVNVTTVNAWEVGKKKRSYKEGERTRPEKEPYDISNTHLCALADLYGVSVDYILGRTDYKTINGADVARITGLSDPAIKVLQLCGGDNPMMYHHARDVSRLLVDWDKNGAESLLSAVSQFIQCPYKRRGQFTPEGGGLAPLDAVEMDMNAALLYGIIAAAERYKADFQNELKAARID